MKIGVVYPQVELGGDPGAVRRIGRATEELGFDHLLAYDHVLGAVHDGREPELTGPYTEHHPFNDPLMMFAHLAAITERIEFVTGVLVLPQRQTALVARQVADVDLFSGGRLRLGVGVGWNYVEYEALGQDFATRGARQEEQIELLRRMWSEPVVDFSGRFDRVDRAALLPRPGRTIPIWLSGGKRVAFERAARLSDGFIFSPRRPFEETLQDWTQLRERVGELGRPVADFGGEYVTGADLGIEEIVANIGAWGQAGGTHACVLSMGRDLGSADAHVEFLETVAAALGLGR